MTSKKATRSQATHRSSAGDAMCQVGLELATKSSVYVLYVTRSSLRPIRS